MAVIAIDLGGTKIEGALYHSDGTVFGRRKKLLDGRMGYEVGVLACEVAVELLAEARANNVSVTGIGVCVPGIVYHQDGSVWAPNIPGWERYPLRNLLQAAFPDQVICVDSDRSCAIYGATWIGAAKGCRNAAFFAVGTGIGLGIKVDDCVLHGAGDIAGAVGWMALQSNYDTKYNHVGCFEYYASGSGIAARARDLLAKEPEFKQFGEATTIDAVRGQDVFAEFDNNNPIAVSVINKAIQLWGMAAANIVSLFNPEKVIWGGGVFGPATRFIDSIRDEAAQWAQPVAMSTVKFVPAVMEHNPMLSGAAYIALNPKTE